MTYLVVSVFIAVYVGMAFGRWPGLAVDRTGVAIIGTIALYLAGAVDAASVSRAIDMPTLIVLFGLMVLSAQFAVAGFYAWCSARIAIMPWSPQWLLALTIAVAGALSTVLANDVVVFAMTPILCLGLRRRQIDARPFVVAIASAANAGSAATLIGNPQNILLGQVGHLDFWAFFAFCAPPALLSLVVVHAVVFVIWRHRFHLENEPEHRQSEHKPKLERASLYKAVIATVALLVLFATPLPHLEGILIVAGALMISRRLATRRYLALVDWPLLVLFAGLFVVTAALAETGLPAAFLDILSEWGASPESLAMLTPMTLVGSLSIGNVPLVMLLLAVLPDPSADTLQTLALLSTLAGNILLTGSLANIIAVERAAEVGMQVGFREHAMCGVPITFGSFAIALAWLTTF